MAARDDGHITHRGYYNPIPNSGDHYTIKEDIMWYFSWVLGLGLACSFAILNAMWLELDDDNN